MNRRLLSHGAEVTITGMRGLPQFRQQPTEVMETVLEQSSGVVEVIRDPAEGHTPFYEIGVRHKSGVLLWQTGLVGLVRTDDVRRVLAERLLAERQTTLEI